MRRYIGATGALARAIFRSGPPAGAGVPRLLSVSPTSGATGVSTQITITGDTLEPGARVSLLGGGPHIAGGYPLSEGAHGVEVHGNHACVTYYNHATKLGGIHLLDISDPVHPVRLGLFETGDSGVGVQMNDSLAYVTFLNPYTFLGGMHVLDVTDPSAIRRLGTFDVLSDPQAI